MKKIIFLILWYPLLLSCTKQIGVQGPAGAQGPAGPGGTSSTDTGTITGSAFLYNEFSFNLPTQAGTVVTLISGTTQRVDTVAANGQFQFHGMQTGTYDLTYALPGFGTVYRYGISHFGGGTVPTEVSAVDLVQIPVKTAIDSMSLVSAYGGYVDVTIRLDTSSLLYVQYYENFMLLIGKSPSVGQMNYVKAYETEFNPDGLGNYTLVISKADLTSIFNTGDTMYITACTYNRYLHPTSSPIWLFDGALSESYVDPNTGYIIYPSAQFYHTPLKLAY